MATVKFGGGIGDIRGAIGSWVFSRNRSGNYIRNRTIPVNPRTQRQVDIRSILTTLIGFWRDLLTAAQREAWDLYASNVSVKNRLGEDIFITGQNHYVRSNAPRIQQLATRIDDAPVLFDVGVQDPTFAVSISAASGLVSVTFDDTLLWVGEDDGHMLVYPGRPVDPTINFFNGPWRSGSAIDGDLALPPTSPSTITNSFTPAVGQQQFVRARISRADGRLTEYFRNEIIVIA